MATKDGKKTGGRKKGTLNKKPTALEEICFRHDVDVFEGMVILAAQCQDPNIKFEWLSRLAPYLYAKKAHVNVGIDPLQNKIEIIMKRWDET